MICEKIMKITTIGKSLCVKFDQLLSTNNVTYLSTLGKHIKQDIALRCSLMLVFLSPSDSVHSIHVHVHMIVTFISYKS